MILTVTNYYYFSVETIAHFAITPNSRESRNKMFFSSTQIIGVSEQFPAVEIIYVWERDVGGPV